MNGSQKALPNKGGSRWALNINGFSYNGEKFMTNGDKKYLAYIDSGNITIQVPSEICTDIKKQMD